MPRWEKEFAMHRLALSFSAGVLGLVLLSGCGSPLNEPFDSNSEAVRLLGGKTFTDADGNVRLRFDDNGKLVEMSVADMPAEYQGITLDGTPFTIPIPNDSGIPPAFAGKGITARLENTKTTIDSNGNIQLVFSGSGGILITPNITLTINAAINSAGTELSNLGINLAAIIPLLGEIPLYALENVAGPISVVQQ
jgi:hypothetical protein